MENFDEEGIVIRGNFGASVKGCFESLVLRDEFLKDVGIEVIGEGWGGDEKQIILNINNVI